MAKPTDLLDPFSRITLLKAEQVLDAGDYLCTVRKCVEVYRRIAELRPEMILKPPNPLMPLPLARSVREGRRNACPAWIEDTLPFAIVRRDGMRGDVSTSQYDADALSGWVAGSAGKTMRSYTSANRNKARYSATV
jgi:hypothetical protein